MLARSLPLLVAFALLACARPAPKGVDDERDLVSPPAPCTSQWERIPTFDDIVIPDTRVTYWRFRFEAHAEDHIALQLHGLFPHARYMNYNVYNQETIDSTDSMPDLSIDPDPGSSNPFRPGTSRDIAQRAYTVWAVPADSPRARDPNVIKMPARAPEKPSQLIDLWYRIYLPDAGADRNGGVPLPSVTAFNDATGQPLVSCPTRKYIRAPVENALKGLPPKGRDGAIVSYVASAHATQANLDNRYSAAQLDFAKGEVAVVRFRAPSFQDTATSDPFPQRPKDVRYWSLCISGVSTRTSACLADAETIIAPDGFVNLVIGPESLAPLVRAEGLNFLPRGKLFVPLLIYRNLLSSRFPGSMVGVPSWPPPFGTRPEDVDAANFIGDYAPAGRHCSLDQYQRTHCGIPVTFGAPKALLRDPPEVAPGARPLPEPVVDLRIGLTWTFFVGNLLEKDLAQDDTPSGPDLSMAEWFLQGLIERSTGLSTKIETAPLDGLADRIAAGEIDIGVLPGTDFEWIRRLHPEFQPLVFGSNRDDDQPQVTAHVLVRRDSPAASLADLKGQRLSVGVSREPSLFFLTKALLESGADPRGYFAKAQIAEDNLEDAADDVVGDYDPASGNFVPSSDAVLLNDNALERYTYRKPGRASRLRIVVSSSPMPAAVFVFDPRKVSPTIAERFTSGLVSANGTWNAAGSFSLFTGRIYELSHFTPVTPEYRSLLEDQRQGLAQHPEFFLPIYFY